MNLKGKKLLLLGGTYNADAIKEYADENGIILVACATTEDHPLCKIADEICLTTRYNDPEYLKQIIKEKNIDGVFPGGNESVIPAIIQVAEEIGIPFYASREQWDIIADKRRFKQECNKVGLPTAPEYQLDDIDNIEFPVIVKPLDGCGSKGIYKCANKEELLEFYPQSKEFSPSGQVIIEKFIEGYGITVYVTAIEGEYYLASMSDKYTLNARGEMQNMPQVYFYPSRNLQMCVDEYYPAIKALYTNLKIKNGVIGIQGFFDGNKITFNEAGYRLGGTSQQNYTKALYGFSNMEYLINFALTGKMTDEPCNENPFYNKRCATFMMICKGGTVGKIVGYEEALKIPGVILIEKHYSEGDVIKWQNNVSMIFFRAFIVEDSVELVKQRIDELQETLHALDTEGNSMLYFFETSRLDDAPFPGI